MMYAPTKNILQKLLEVTFSNVSILQEISDDRLKQTREMLQGMKLIKLYGWEKTFCDIITSVRNREIKKLMLASVFLSVSGEFRTQFCSC